jgi:CubicO group peptidase (beta-lactamase class C family)
MTSSDFAPGGSHAPEYSNIGFCALSEVIRKTSGESYSDYIQANMLGPLGMNDTALGFTQRSKQQDREVVYYPCGYSPDKPGPRPTGFCGYGVDSSAILGPSLFPADGTTSAAYGGGTSTYSPEASEGAGGLISTAIDLAHFTGAIASGKLPNFSGPLCLKGDTSPSCGWPAKYYEYSTKIPPYETNSCSGWFGMGWDTVQSCTGLPASFLPYDNFNFFKGGGTPGTTSGVWATADGYGLAVVVNGDIGKSINVFDVLSPAYNAAVAHAKVQPWTNINFSAQYAQGYSDWMAESDFATYLTTEQSKGLYPSRLEGRVQFVQNVGGVGFTQVLEYRARFGSQPAGATPPPQYVYGQSCPAVLGSIRSAGTDTPLVSLQRFTDPNTGSNLYQAVWSAPIPQLPSH